MGSPHGERTLPGAGVRLLHNPGKQPPYQWHADRVWKDPDTEQPTSYLAGFWTEEDARRYGKRNGWLKDGTEN
jgi:hypothetical protein